MTKANQIIWTKTSAVSLLASLLFFSPLPVKVAFADTDPKFYAVEVSASVQALPAQILLSWPADGNATSYTVSRKSLEATSWNTIGSLPGSATAYTDLNVADGSAYEYQVSKSTSIGYQGFGYIYAGINAPLTESRGQLVLIVDNTYATELAAELNRLQQDLVGDGWVVLRHDVSRTDSTPAVKSLIQADYNANPSATKAVFLFGHVPVPYSGDMNPDQHSDHRGAWPADVYYGDMDGTWTDAFVSDNYSAQREANHNVPGDGKFDQSNLPSDVEIPVGRVDLYNMTCYSNKAFSRSELDLLRQYLNKDHNFRHKLLNVERRGLICDNFGERGGEAFAASGWRNFAPFFGASNNVAAPGGTYFSTLNNAGYLWSYGTGGGALYSCDGIGTSDSFATNDIKSVFTMFLGSYFGDWDNESNFLRAPLGSSTYCLTTSWAGRPHWFYHHMGLGETIGYSTLLSQNNSGIYQPLNMGTRGVHVALLGDPALRMHPVAPVSNLSATVNGGVALLNWSASPDSSIVGYHVYRASTPTGPFVRLNPIALATTAFTDLNGSAGSTYMVRAIKLEQSGSGTYFNASQGIFYPDATGGAVPTPNAPSNLTAATASSYQIDLTWSDNSNNETSFVLQRSSGGANNYAPIITLPANTKSYSDKPLQSQTAYSYRLCAMNTSGASAFSSPAGATTTATVSTPAAASFVKVDSTTKGSWKGAYGSDGWSVIGDTERYPGYVQTGASGQAAFSWNDATADTRALQYSTKDGHLAECWYSPTSFTVDLNFLDTQSHLLALYCLDWDRNGRVQTIEVSDAATGTVFDTQTVSAFQEGKYLIWQAKGHIRIKFTHVVGFNTVVCGLFFDPVPATTAPPLGGSIANGQFQLRLAGQPGQVFKIYSSSDLLNWSQIDTVTLVTTSLNYSDPTGAGSTQRFYRAVQQ